MFVCRLRARVIDDGLDGLGHADVVILPAPTFLVCLICPAIAVFSESGEFRSCAEQGELAIFAPV